MYTSFASMLQTCLLGNFEQKLIISMTSSCVYTKVFPLSIFKKTSII